MGGVKVPKSMGEVKVTMSMGSGCVVSHVYSDLNIICCPDKDRLVRVDSY